jgi:hypothetical protein
MYARIVVQKNKLQKYLDSATSTSSLSHPLIIYTLCIQKRIYDRGYVKICYRYDISHKKSYMTQLVIEIRHFCSKFVRIEV